MGSTTDIGSSCATSQLTPSTAIKSTTSEEVIASHTPGETEPGCRVQHDPGNGSITRGRYLGARIVRSCSSMFPSGSLLNMSVTVPPIVASTGRFYDSFEHRVTADPTSARFSRRAAQHARARVRLARVSSRAEAPRDSEGNSTLKRTVKLASYPDTLALCYSFTSPGNSELNSELNSQAASP